MNERCIVIKICEAVPSFQTHFAPFVANFVMVRVIQTMNMSGGDFVVIFL